MASVAEHMINDSGWSDSAVSVDAKLRARDGGRAMKRGAQRFIGFSLVLAAFGIWVAPGATWDNELNLFKMLVSLTCALSGAALWQVGKPVSCPELEIDTIRQEVRLVRWEGNQRELVSRRRFRDLEMAEVDGKMVRLWQSGGELLAEVEISDRGSLRALLAGLRRSGVERIEDLSGETAEDSPELAKAA